MRKVFLSLLLIGLTALQAVGQCPGGVCYPPQIDVRSQEPDRIQAHRPTPAWRYEQARGHRAAVVRIYGHDTVARRSIGSGVLVRFGKRILVLTARHVVKDAQKIFVEFHTAQRCRARVILADATWDCAALEIDQQPEGIEPAEMEWGEAAMCRAGDRLESCGYGPDGRLAVNSGRFIGYRRTTARRKGPDDWMVLSGLARGGDSGGPIFNEHGRVVGILWGTDGSEVVGVQAGRVHLVLREAVARTYQQKQIVERMPTPPLAAPLVPVAPERPAVAPETCDAARVAGLPTLLPWRGEAERRDNDQRATIDRLIQLERLRQADRDAQTPVVESPSVITPENATPATSPSPLLAGLCALGGVALGFVVYFANEKGNGNG